MTRIWLETLGTVLLALAGVALGVVSSRLRGRWWPAGYFVGLAYVVLVGMAYWRQPLQFVAPFSWLTAGRTEFAIWGLMAGLLLITPLSRLRSRSQQVLVVFLLGMVVWRYSVWPFAAPGMNRAQLLQIESHIDADGVCLQSTDYNCGPAAAVTALRRLGIAAEERDIAIAAHTSRATGTQPDVLAQTLRSEFAQAGVTCELRAFRAIDELTRIEGLVIAVVKFRLFVDHYVTVLKVTEHDVTVADPLSGVEEWPRAEFQSRWRRVGLVVNRKEVD